MSNNIQPQPHINNLTNYVPGMAIETVATKYGLQTNDIVKLASNENPYGMSDEVRAAITKSMHEVNRYPIAESLRTAIAEQNTVEVANVIVGNGSNEILDLVARVYLGNGDSAVTSQYAFSVYGLVTALAGARTIVAPAIEYGHDLEAMSKAINDNTRLVWIANPNNPTGTFISTSALQHFIQAIDPSIIVVVDEAYREYLEPENQSDIKEWLSDFPNVIITRTFSKLYGLAGLRVGYALASERIISFLNRARQPFNVNSLAVQAALAALDDGVYAQLSYQRNKDGLRQLSAGLDKLGLAYLPTYGNFITVAVDDASAVNEHLLRNGIIVRPLGEYGLPEFLRVSVGTPVENERFLTVLGSRFSGNASHVFIDSDHR